MKTMKTIEFVEGFVEEGRHYEARWLTKIAVGNGFFWFFSSDTKPTARQIRRWTKQVRSKR